MLADEQNSEFPLDNAGWFRTTHWSVVVLAARGATPGADAAMERLCRTYWYPLYAYVRRRGCSAEDGQDLTQEFFARLVKKDYLGNVGPRSEEHTSELQSPCNLVCR